MAPTAGELISELTVAIQTKIGLGTLGRVIHPYPTVSEGIASCGIQYNRTVWKKKGDVEEEDEDAAGAPPSALPGAFGSQLFHFCHTSPFVFAAMTAALASISTILLMRGTQRR